MKVDFKRVKREIWVGDFVLNVGWKFVGGCCKRWGKMSNGRDRIVMKGNGEKEYRYWDVERENVRGRRIVEMMEEDVFERRGKEGRLREVGEMLEKQINRKEIISGEKRRQDVGKRRMSREEVRMQVKEVLGYKGNYVEKGGI